MNSFFDEQQEMLMLVDAHAIIYRAYYSFPPTLTTPEGTLVNAAFGFTRILLTAIRDMHPSYMAVVFDHPKPTFRHEEFKAYKAHREKMPDDLIPQIGITKDIVQALNIPQFSVAGFEADDLIGTLSRQAMALQQEELTVAGLPPEQKKIQTVVVTGDQDLFQLVNEQIHVWLPPRGKRHPAAEYDTDRVEKKMGVRPDQVIDLKALMGDASDNIPGIKGVGPKTATKLLQKFETLEKLYQALEKPEEYPDLFKGALLKKLQEGKESAFMSQKLATISQEAPIDLDLAACKVTGYDKTQAVALFQDLEFRSLVNSLPADEFESSIQESLF